MTNDMSKNIIFTFYEENKEDDLRDCEIDETENIATLYRKCREVCGIDDLRTVGIYFNDTPVDEADKRDLRTHFSGLNRVLVKVENTDDWIFVMVPCESTN
ncbi:hypothetical protein GGF44_002454 [Coemansia sp. RSA 1694]|nr:hypothetical protein GGF44_002454 [Coemansia sp. RSA 1694]